jgi:hypothetical protein
MDRCGLLLADQPLGSIDALRNAALEAQTAGMLTEPRTAADHVVAEA